MLYWLGIIQNFKLGEIRKYRIPLEQIFWSAIKWIKKNTQCDSIIFKTIFFFPSTRDIIRKSLDDPAKFHSLCTCRGHRSLQSMIKCFEIFLPIVRGNFLLLHDMAYDFCKRQADQNIIYTEVRYNPHLLASNGSFVKSEKDDIVDPRPVIDAVTTGLRDGEEKFGIQVNQILCCIAWRPDWADEIVELANERRNSFPCAVVGVDIAAGEEHFDETAFPNLFNPHYEAFQKAKKLDLNVTLHAGEVAHADNISKAVEIYGAQRIGHGYQINDQKELMRQMKDKKIHFEVCPTSSVETGGWVYDDEDVSPVLSSPKKQQKDWKKHPAVTMIDNGINIGFNSDDPAVFNTSLTWQLRIAHKKMGLTRETIWNSILHSVNATFLNDKDKQQLKKRIEIRKREQENTKVGIKLHESFSERVFTN